MTADEVPRNFLLRDLPADVRTGVEVLADTYGVSINAAFKIVLTTGLAAHRTGAGPVGAVVLRVYDDSYNVLYWHVVQPGADEIRIDPNLPIPTRVRAFGIQRG